MGRLRLMLLLPVTMVGAIIFAVPAAHSQRDEMSLESIAAGMEIGFRAIDRVTAIVTVSKTTPDAIAQSMREADDQILVTTWSVQTCYWAVDGPKLYMEFLEPAESPRDSRVPPTLREVLASNGEEYRSFRVYASPDDPAQEGRISGGRTPAADFVVHGMFKLHEELDPRHFAYFSGDISIADILRDPASGAQVLRAESLYGAECAVVNARVAGMGHTWWIDLDHAFMVRQLAVSQTIEGQEMVRIQGQVPEIIGSAGMWLPMLVETEVTLPIGTITGELVINEIAFDVPLPPSMFLPAFPRGTSISDHFDMQSYDVIWQKPWMPGDTDEPPH